MIFVIGGSYQGKGAYVRDAFGITQDDVFVCTEETREIDFSKRCIAHIERFALGCVLRGEEPSDYWRAHIGAMQNAIVIADDISCGVVPIDDEMRAWREASGRANNYLTGEAAHVHRVFCGLGQVLK